MISRNGMKELLKDMLAQAWNDKRAIDAEIKRLEQMIAAS